MKPKREGRPPRQSEPEPRALEELADQIHGLFIRLEDAGAPDQVEAKAARAFAIYYQKHLELGGRPFQATKNWLFDLVTLEQRCAGEVTSELDNSTQRRVEGEWSQPMSKGKIKAALGLDSYYMLDKLSKERVYWMRQGSYLLSFCCGKGF